jgi:hypothetical protein
VQGVLHLGNIFVTVAFGVLVMRMTLHVFPRLLVFMTPAV